MCIYIHIWSGIPHAFTGDAEYAKLDGMGIIAGELALDVALDSKGDAPLPDPLRHAEWRQVPHRSWSWWRTL